MLNNRHPMDQEIDARRLAVEGKLPPSLRGTLYRNGPNPRAGTTAGHWFLGDGMIHAVSFRDGHCAYRNRWVLPAGEGNSGLGRANTHVIPHAGRLLALEEAHAPIAMDPRTLALGGLRYEDAPFTAHPKRDPVTGELVFFGYAAEGAGSRAICCGKLDADGHLVWKTCFDAPFCSMVHDAAVTKRHIALPILPLAVASPFGSDGTFDFVWQPELGGHLAVLELGAMGRDVRWHETPSVYAFHIANAWEDRDRLFLDLFVYDAPPLFPIKDGTVIAGRDARLCRWSVALDDSAPVRVEPLYDLAGEFPRIDERRAGRPYNQVYCTSRNGPDRSGFHAIARLDLEHGVLDRFDFGLDAFVSEPVFVARTCDAPADDGWLLSMVWHPDWASSRLVVFNATHVADGPVASVILPHRVPDGFHGSFLPDVFLDLECIR